MVDITSDVNNTSDGNNTWSWPLIMRMTRKTVENKTVQLHKTNGPSKSFKNQSFQDHWIPMLTVLNNATLTFTKQKQAHDLMAEQTEAQLLQHLSAEIYCITTISDGGFLAFLAVNGDCSWFYYLTSQPRLRRQEA